jgi:hypothetical protein
MEFHYAKICSNLLRKVPERQKTVLSQRFGLDSPTGETRRETLEFIGKNYGITRERVRQIEKDGFARLREESKKYPAIFQYFKNYLKNQGELKKEDILLADLGNGKWQNQIYFLLNLGEDFERIREDNNFYPFWTINRTAVDRAKKIVDLISAKLEKTGRPLHLKELKSPNPLNLKTLNSYLETSKKVQKNAEGLFGLRIWPEINPKGIKDKAYLVFKKEKKPLHFVKVADLIPSALPQTVHNELIKDPRFVLVGRGIYALKEWGYKEGAVKDIIVEVLKEAGRPLSKEDILKRVLKERFVKENTILLNLSNRQYFAKNSGGLYILKKQLR